jgi:hypothetical protein
MPSVAKTLAQMEPADLEDGDADWLGMLAQAWRLVGDAAAAAGDSAKAETYLLAAWRVQLLPEAGWALGNLREKQGRLADAVELWSMAAGVAGPRSSVLPEDSQQRIQAACAKLPDVERPGIPSALKGAPGEHVDVLAEPARQSQARIRLMDLRTVRLKGPVVADVTEQVLLLADVEGRVERLLNVSRKSPKDFERQLASLDPLRVAAWPQPDEHRYKAVRRGVFTCFAATGCALVLDLPEPPAPQVGTKGFVRLTSVEPKDGSTLQPGQRVTVVAKGHYQFSVQDSVRLVVLSGPSDLSHPAAVNPVVESKSQALNAGEGDVILSVTFTAPPNPQRLVVLLAGTTPAVAPAWATYEVR